jgi:hypothetical protein
MVAIEETIAAAKTFLSNPSAWDWDFIKDCYSLSWGTFVMLLALESFTWYNVDWQNKLKDEKIKKLYMSACLSTGFHLTVIGPIAYGISRYIIDRSTSPFHPYLATAGAFATQAVGYALAHAWMHRDENYWIHKYHHEFKKSTFVRPVSANTVTITEFCVAYALPIVTGLIVFRPPMNNVWWLTMAISGTNLLIHTPPTILGMKWMPSYLVTNDKHFRHHEENVRVHYSAPIFDLDYLLGIGEKKTPAKAALSK